MFTRNKTATAAQEVIDEACCIVDDEISAVAEECCVEAEQTNQEAADAAILAKGHPGMYQRRKALGEAWWDMSSEERDEVYNQYHVDLDAYHDAYLRVHGVECRDCTC
jgi:hypothetical protein